MRWCVCALVRSSVRVCVCERWRCVRVPAPALGVVREMSLLLRVTNLWESCSLQLTLTRGSSESG